MNKTSLFKNVAIIILILMGIIIILAICKKDDYQNEFYSQKAIGNVTEYYEKEEKLIVVVFDDDIEFYKHFSIENDTCYTDDKILKSLQNRETGISVVIESEYDVNEIYGTDGPPWVFPATYIGLNRT